MGQRIKGIASSIMSDSSFLNCIQCGKRMLVGPAPQMRGILKSESGYEPCRGKIPLGLE